MTHHWCDAELDSDQPLHAVSLHVVADVVKKLSGACRHIIGVLDVLWLSADGFPHAARVHEVKQSQ